MEHNLQDRQTGLWARLRERAAAWNDPEARQQRGRLAGQRRRLARDWARIHLRRMAHRTHGSLAIHQAVGPVSFLVVSAALGVALTLTTLYTPSYAVTVDGAPVGVVADRDVVDRAIADVEAQGSSLLGYDYQVQGDIGYQFALTLKTDLNSQNQIEDYFYSQLNDVSVHLRKCEVVVDGQAVGVVKDETALRDMLDDLKNQYVNENTTSVEFMQDMSIQYVYAADSVLTTEEMQAALQSSGNGSGTYTVVKGDTFNGIAYANNMSISDLKALNPGVDINRLMIGDVLNVKAQTPVLSVKTTEHQVYTQEIECPVETREDSSMYKGTSKIVTQGVKGEAKLEADVTYVNGQEQQRDILSNVTVRSPPPPSRPLAPRRSPRPPPPAPSPGPSPGASTPISAGGTSLAGTAITPASTSPQAMGPASGLPTAARSPSPGTRAAMAIWWSSPTTTAPRPITATTPRCWYPPDRRYPKDRPSPGRAAPAAPPAPTAISRSGSGGFAVNPLNYLR